jgi:homoserine dehydrogenase
MVVKPVKVGICGMGTVGGGTFDVLNRNASEIARRAGRRIQIEQVAMRRPNPAIDTTGIQVTSDIFEIATNPEIDIVIELIGGYETAFDLVMTAIQNGKHVVTANKALIAVHGNEIFAAAQEKNVMVAFEASVAGGIPIIKAIREGLSANKIDWLAGIINGTGNFILTEMRDKGRDFADVLAEAQELGYAEADPTFDVEGIDAAHKLCILASIAFGIPLNFDAVYTQGISMIDLMDLDYAEELGYRIKHLGIARRTDKGVEMRVHLTLIPESQLLANVNGVMNAVQIHGDAVGSTLHYGPGAGSLPTASAVVADLVDVARVLTADPTNRVPHLAFQPTHLNDLPILPIEETICPFYVRLSVRDEVGVLAHITRTLADQNVSLESVIQKDGVEGEPVALILLTHSVREKDVLAALSQIEQQSFVVGNPVILRCEDLRGTA